MVISTFLKHPLRSLLQIISPVLNQIKRISSFSVTNYKVIHSQYTPYSAGSSNLVKKFTKSEINGIFGTLGDLICETTQLKKLEPIKFKEYLELNEYEPGPKKSGMVFKEFGTNKHEPLHEVYDFLATKKINNILEIGIGSNNKKILSYMPSNIKPGSSLFSFRSIFPNAKIYGADYDTSILFTENRITTEFVNQLDVHSMTKLFQDTVFDLIIDDGFHSARANINSIILATNRLTKGGILVIEDVNPDSIQIWNVVQVLIESDFQLHFITENNYSFIIIEKNE